MSRLYVSFSMFIIIFVGANFRLALLSAQTPVNIAYQKSIDEFKQQIGIWEHQVNIQGACIVAVVVFGTLVSAFQKSDKNWSKVATVVLGIAISIVTAINARIFPADYRSLQHAATEGQGIVRKLDSMMAVFVQAQPNGEDLKKFNADFLKCIENFNQISKNLEGSGSVQTDAVGSQASITSALPLVYAQSSSLLPAWVRALPVDNRSFYFIGKSSDASLSAAKTASLNDAVAKASSALVPGEPYTANTPIRDAAVVQDTFFDYDKRSASYNYYTLLRISREIQNFRPALAVYQQKRWRPADLTFDPTAGLFLFDDDGAVAKIKIDQEGIHLESLFRLKLSDRPASLTANAQSVFASSNNKLGCSVYKFTLASRKTTNRLIAVGEGGCDGIATDGNAVYLVLPKKKEIRYWPDWDSSSPKSWSLNEIDQGGPLTLDRTGHRLIFADASGTGYAISVPEGKIQLLASNVGVVHSIATDTNHILLASGKKVLFFSRSDNRGENPPASMGTLTGGVISGVAVDTTDSAWIADFDNGLVKGPFPLNR